jgi:hypothetical protein
MNFSEINPDHSFFLDHCATNTEDVKSRKKIITNDLYLDKALSQADEKLELSNKFIDKLKILQTRKTSNFPQNLIGKFPEDAVHMIPVMLTSI